VLDAAGPPRPRRALPGQARPAGPLSGTSLPPQNSEEAPPVLARLRARFELLLNAAVGFVWGPLLFHFFVHVAGRSSVFALALCVALTLALGQLGARAPVSYFRLRPWERARGGRIYERYFLIRGFKRWMSNGDWMNAWLRRRVPDYRVVRPTRAAAAAYAERTLGIERAHLAWFLGALAPMGYALLVGAPIHAALWALANTITNVWPILLQRYNRVRALRASRDRSAAT
jgi:hypothetical protein